MSSGDNLPGASPIVVATVVRDDCTTSDEVIVVVENKAGPGELSRRRFTVFEAIDWPRELPCATGLG